MLKAIGYRVLIKPDEVETHTAGGIELVFDKKIEKIAIQTGTVVDIGPIAFKEYVLKAGEPVFPRSDIDWIKVGDKVLFSKYGGKWVYDPVGFDPLKADEADQYIIIDDSDVLCKIIEE